jgi:maltose alpha-D-glucosyltransferase / alpha-amylase
MSDPLWFQDAVIHQLNVCTFRGLISELDDLGKRGVTVLWLLPFYPSLLREGGTLADFREFLDEAHQRGFRVITELALDSKSENPDGEKILRETIDSVLALGVDGLRLGASPHLIAHIERSFPDRLLLAPLVAGEVEATWQSSMEMLQSARFAEQVLPASVRHCRWFGGKAHALRSVRILDTVPLGVTATGRDAGRLAFLQVNYLDIEPEIYLLPLQLASASQTSGTIVARLSSPAGEGVVFDTLDDESFHSALFEIILGEKRVRTGSGELSGICGAALKAQADTIALPLASRALRAEQSNSAIVYDDRFFLKLYRKPELGENPDAELLRFLSERQHFENVPAFCGAIEHRVPGSEPRVLALLVAIVPNEGDAWSCTLEALGGFFARVLSQKPDPAGATPARIAEVVGNEYRERARQLGERTAQMHLALAGDASDPNFAPEKFTDFDQQSLCQSMHAGTRRMSDVLNRKLAGLPEDIRHEAAALLGREDEILRRQSAILQCKVTATRTRHHGDYHLGQVLNTGSDFVIIDFEGEPARALSERRMKRSPLRDVAGMLRSFHYAAHTALARHRVLSAEDSARLGAWAEMWVESISREFLDAYLSVANGASFIPDDAKTLEVLLEVFLLEKAAYEVCYELNNRPDWLFIPMRGITRILNRGV